MPRGSNLWPHMVQSRHPLLMPFIWLLAIGFGLIACRMDQSEVAEPLQQTISATPGPLRQSRLRQSEDEQKLVLLVPEMDNILSARRATKALEALPEVIQVKASTIVQTVEIITDGPASEQRFVQALKKAGLYGVLK